MSIWTIEAVLAHLGALLNEKDKQFKKLQEDVLLVSQKADAASVALAVAKELSDARMAALQTELATIKAGNTGTSKGVSSVLGWVVAAAAIGGLLIEIFRR